MTRENSNTEHSASSVEALLEKAFSKGAGLDANQLIHDVRLQIQSEYGRAANYEVSLLERTWDEMRRTEAARFGRFLNDMGFRARPYNAVFVSVFHGETVYFIRAEDFLDALAADPVEVVMALPGSTQEPTSD